MEFPPELKEISRYLNEPLLEKNIDDLDPKSPTFADTIKRLIYFPSDKFTLKPLRL